ncbi:MAG: hypothetical protein FRX49_03305 [Trebouxia sp. A1-2]|nr:MAG: hypothetical protein FRX49_03305 [Trebouxia sp. A1-2]
MRAYPQDAAPLFSLVHLHKPDDMKACIAVERCGLHVVQWPGGTADDRLACSSTLLNSLMVKHITYLSQPAVPPFISLDSQDES